MDRDSLNIKLQSVFRKLLDADYAPNNSFCLDKLLMRLSDPIPRSNGLLMDMPAVIEFISFFFVYCDEHPRKANYQIKVFALKLVATATKVESIRKKLFDERVFTFMFKVFNIQGEKNPSVKLALLDVLNSLIPHHLGVEWLLANEKWLEVLNLCQQNQTIYFFREGTKFLKNLIWKLNDMDQIDPCHEILNGLVTPLLVNKWSGCTIVDDEADSQMYSAFYPSLTILTDVLYSVERFGKTNHVIKYLATKFNLKWQLWPLLQSCRKTNLLNAMSKLIYIHWIADVSIDEEIYILGDKQLCEYAMIQCNTISGILCKRNPEVIIEISSFAFILLCKIRDHHKIKMTFEKEGKNLDFTNQIMIMSLVPMICTLKLSKNEFVDAYVDKLVSTVCEHTTRLIYSFRDLIKEKNEPTVIIKAIQSTISYMKYLDKSQAVLIFQSFFYCLHDFIPHDVEASDYVVIGIDSRETVTLVCTMLEAIYLYIDHFGIQWQETVESLCVHNFCARVLKTSNIDPKLNILAFKLSELTIKKYLSPNLALLTNSANGSVIEDLSRNIYVKLHDPNWCIRDSAMELLNAVVEIAECKFTAFQQQITENELPELVVTLAFEDSETYVRASALKCISKMVKIKMFWEKHLKYSDLPVKLMKMLYEESEGLVRKDAVLVITNMYIGKKFGADILDDIFITMFHSAVKDLHWEVQLSALEFWREVIHSQMSHQGMIDGVFPSVTFSKENRKIVNLTDVEIQKRLKKILHELALRGCLGALLCCMDDESEIKVMEKSFEVMKELLQLFNIYNLREIDSIPGTPSLPVPVFDASSSKSESDIAEIKKYRNKADVRNETTGGEVSITLNSSTSSECDKMPYDRVIECIVNSDDVNLLASVYTNQLKVKDSESLEKYDFAKTNGVKDINKMFIDPKVFLKTVTETNFQSIIDEKYRWRTGISSDIDSLVQDILSIYTVSAPADVNTLDCY